jgi:phage terminase small subunit
MAGRRPKPSATRKTREPRSPFEPQPAFLKPRKAAALGDEYLIGQEARRLWKHLYEPLIDCHLATEADIFALLELAESIGEMRETRLAIRALDEQLMQLQAGDDLGNGQSLLNESLQALIGQLERKRGALKLDVKWAYERVRDLMSGMGCTPAARSKIRVDDAQTDLFADAMRMIDVSFVDSEAEEPEPAGAVSG